MPRYIMTIAYDGSNYHGWQIQPDVETIVGTLQAVFFAVFKLPIIIIGASRTDAGVHALGQVAIFDLSVAIDPAIVMWAWNNKLPGDILIRKLQLISDNFHPQADVVQKTYYYHFFLDRPLPFMQRYGWYYKQEISLDAVNSFLQIFKGTHDFRSFCTGDEMGPDTIRTINLLSITYLKRYNVYQIEVKGQRFMRYMIRRIVGAALTATAKKWRAPDLYDILQAKNPEHTLLTAPAKGLMLHSIHYQSKGVL